MNKFLYILLFLLFGCEDIPQESNIVLDTQCIYPLKMYLKHDFIQGDPNQDFLIGSNVCHYDNEKRVIKEDIYDFFKETLLKNIYLVTKLINIKKKK